MKTEKLKGMDKETALPLGIYGPFCTICQRITVQSGPCLNGCDDSATPPAVEPMDVTCPMCYHAKAGHVESEGGCSTDFCDCGLVPCPHCGTLSQSRAPEVTEAMVEACALAIFVEGGGGDFYGLFMDEQDRMRDYARRVLTAALDAGAGQ